MKCSECFSASSSHISGDVSEVLLRYISSWMQKSQTSVSFLCVCVCKTKHLKVNFND